jgi:hypothetical protein
LLPPEPKPQPPPKALKNAGQAKAEKPAGLDGAAAGPQPAQKKVQPARLELVGRLAAKDRVSLANLAVQGNHAYLVRGDTLRVVDITTRTNPRVIGNCKIPGAADAAEEIAVASSYAYVVGGGSLHVVDIAKPDAPLVIASCDLRTTGLQAIALARNYAYISGGKGLHIIDIADPKAPREVGSCSVKGGPAGIAVVPSRPRPPAHVCVATESDGLRIVEVSQPAMPREVGRLSSDVGEEFIAVAVAGHFAYVADFNGARAALWIIDIFNPTVPRKTAAYGDWVTSGVAVAGQRVFLAGGSLDVLDVSDPTKPQKIGHYPDKNAELAGRVVVAGDYVYLTGQGEHDFTILRVVPLKEN